MNVFYRLCLVASLSLIATGCVFIDGKHVNKDDWWDTQRDNREAISRLDIGMEREAVIARLGAPDDSEAFNTDNGEEVRVLFYRTTHKHSDGETTRDETTPLVFQDDVLTGWGHSVYEAVR